ncbi:MAG: hypothetical protein IT204_02120 [Fimbriimonadaceae bacterium]|nr:hypothetical protein [Fimbriimonadaceae bacterium]
MIRPRAAATLLRLYASATLAVLLAVGWWTFGRGAELAQHPRNSRYWQALRGVQRGRILAADGTPLAVSERVDQGARQRPIFTRRYPGGPLYAHLVGYSDFDYGESGVELALKGSLLNLRAGVPTRRDVAGLLWQSLAPPPPQGDDVTLTIDPGLQQLAAADLGERRGAVVALDVRTGAVLCLVDWPGYDPAELHQQWRRLNSDARRPLVARAYQAPLPPGSVFKVLTAAAALQAGVATPDSSYLCRGVQQLAHSRVVCHERRGHGRLTLRQAIAKSCNIALAEVALALGPANFENALRGMGFDQRAQLFAPGRDDLGLVAKGVFPKGAALTPQELAACGYGQGALALTPLQVARIGQMLGHGGVLLEPRLVRQITRPGGEVVYRLQPSAGQPEVGPAAAREVLQMMRGTLRSGGTAAHLAVAGLDAAAKTGSAENPRGEAHSWFLAVAPVAAPRVAVAVVIEHGGYGGRAAGPVAMAVLRRALRVAQ